MCLMIMMFVTWKSDKVLGIQSEEDLSTPGKMSYYSLCNCVSTKSYSESVIMELHNLISRKSGGTRNMLKQLSEKEKKPSKGLLQSYRLNPRIVSTHSNVIKPWNLSYYLEILKKKRLKSLFEVELTADRTDCCLLTPPNGKMVVRLNIMRSR